MNVQLIYPRRVEDWDSPLSAAGTLSALDVLGADLVLSWWPRANPDLEAESRVLATLPGEVAGDPDLPTWCDLANERLGLLRLDVNGEAVYVAGEDQ